MDSKVKQRLVGAIVLIGLAVILLPIIFRSGNIPVKNITLSPQAPQTPAKPKVEIFLAQQEKIVQQKRADLVNTQAQREQHIKQAKEQKRSHAQIQARSEVKKALKSYVSHAKSNNQPKSTKAYELTNTVWAVQLASFRDQTYALRLEKKLKKQGYKAYVQKLSNSKGMLYRVMVGPVKQKQMAQKLQKKLNAVVKLQGLLLNINRMS